MGSYSVAEAKNRLPALDQQGDRGRGGGHHPSRQAGRGVAPHVAEAKRQVAQTRTMLRMAQLARRDARRSVSITSVELLNQMYEDDER